MEYRTPVLYHASATVLAPLDRLQEWVLRDLGLSEEEALEHFSLAPLSVRRDIAMLGVVFRAVLQKGPPQLRSFFRRAEQRRETRSSEWHGFQLQTYRDGEHLEVQRRSVLGLVEVFNLLPPAIVQSAKTVQSFQAQLQELVLTAVKEGVQDWKLLLAADRTSWERRELRQLRGWESNWRPVLR